MTDSTTDAYTQAVDWLLATAKRNPEALLVLGAGLALLMRGGGQSSATIPASSGYAGATAATPPPGWNVSRAAENVTGYASDVKDRMAGAASTATEYAGNVGRTLSSETTRLADQANTAIQSGTSRMLDTQPLAVAVFGVAAGAALAVLIPPTEVESRTLGSTREAIVDAANQVGENLLGAAGEAGERLKQGAAERGLSVDGIKELAHDVGDAFASKVSGSAKNDPQ